MDKLKTYLVKNFEQSFVLFALLVTALINYYIPQKIAFLNFYFLPIILGGYYLGRRKAVLGAVLCILMVSGYVVLSPESFGSSTSNAEVYSYIVVWGGFLILAGAVVGKLQEKLSAEVELGHGLNRELARHQDELTQANAALQNYNTDLEVKVGERTEELEGSKRSVESLKSKVEEALYATMDSSVVKLMIEGRLRIEKRNASILFSDLVGFTEYSEEQPPEVVIRDLNRYLSEMEPILLAYRGHIDRYMGDGIMCEFGAPLDYETHRLLAVIAGMKLQEKMAQVDYPWKMRVGIASGGIITGLIGCKRQTYTAIGDVVNLASRLETACCPGRVMIDQHTYEGVKHFIVARKLRGVPARETTDADRERQLEALYNSINGDQGDTQAYFKIGRIHMELQEIHEAFHYFERALEQDPDNRKVKVAYAEAGMKVKEAEKISVKGKRARIEAYEVLGLKDPFEDREKIPQSFYDDNRKAMENISIPDDVILPVEALDGSIGHSKTVAVISYAIAHHLGLSETEKQDILRAGFLADIGKQVVPHHLLNRKGHLTASEFEMVRMHPVEGSKIIRNMGYDNQSMIGIVLHSHENFDGSGYPDGLVGNRIPIGSRIVAAADVYTALTSKRPYRDSWERHAALDEIARGVERGMYDPNVVRAMQKILG